MKHFENGHKLVWAVELNYSATLIAFRYVQIILVVTVFLQLLNHRRSSQSPKCRSEWNGTCVYIKTPV